MTANRCSIGAVVNVVAAAGLATALSGCATIDGPNESVRLVWPPPPLTARIEFVRNIFSDEDLGRDTTFAQRLTTFLSGHNPTPNRIIKPMGLVISDDGQRLYVSDFTHLAVFIFDFENRTFAKIGAEEKLTQPIGLVLDGEENLYVVEQGKKGISVFDRNRKKIRFISAPDVERPTGIALDRHRGRIYLADTAHTKSTKHTVKIFNLGGEPLGVIGGAKGTNPGQFMFPTYLAVDQTGYLYVTDTLNSRVQMFDPDGNYVQSFGSRGNAWGMFDKPKGVAVDGFGNVYVVDSGWSNVQIFNRKGKALLFFGGRGPIPGLLKNPTAIAIDNHNHIYVADYLNHRIGVYRLVNTTLADSFLTPPTAEEQENQSGKNEIAAVSASD